MSSVRFSENVLHNAELIARDCMGTEDAFCKSRCPMSTDAKKYINLIAEHKYDEAIKTIRETLFLPNTLGRVCAHPCELKCRRNKEFQQPVSIAALKRFAAEKADNEVIWDLEIAPETGKKVAIIGSGPAGAQAAIDLRKAGHAVTIYERSKHPGGMLRNGIPTYRLPRTILDFEYSYLDKLGITFKLGVNVGTDITFEQLQQDYNAVLIANGAQKGNIISMPGSTSNGVFSATEFLHKINMTHKFEGVGKRVLIIGGGDVAMDCARSAIRLGNIQVHLCSLESEDILPASLEEKEEALEEGVLCNFGWGPIEIFEKNGNVSGIKLQKIKSVFDENGKFAPQYDDETKILEVDTIIMATGQIVEDVTNGLLKQVGGGRYQVDSETLATDIENVFVAGDAAGGKIVVEAMALGRKAAISINRLLAECDLKENRDFQHEWAYETKLDVPLPEGTSDLPRIHKNLRPVAERIKDFDAIDLGLTEQDALQEASRCLQCECRLCVKECAMLQQLNRCPQEICSALLTECALDTGTAYSCNDCNTCSAVCPQKLSVKEIFMEARKDFINANNGEPPLNGHRAVKIHQELGFSSLYITKVRGGRQNE